MLDEESSGINFINQQENTKKFDSNQITINEEEDDDSDDRSVISMTWKIS